MTAGPAHRAGALLRDVVALAAGTLTAIPVRPPGRVDRRTAGWAMTVAPMVMLPVLVAAAVLTTAGAAVGLPATVLAVLVLGILALSNRGLHLDGLADTCDALATGFDRGKALAVLRRGDVGPAGVAAPVLVLLVQLTTLAAVLAEPGQTPTRPGEPDQVLAGLHLAGLHPAGLVTMAVAVLASRHDLAWACRSGQPVAHRDGLGVGVIGTVSRPALGCAAVLLILVSVAAAVAVGRPGWTGLASPVAAVATGELVRRRATRRFGGLSGDVLGAGVELALAAALLAGLVATGIPGSIG